MARGRGAGRNALSEGKIGELIRGNTEALQKQAALGGNAPKATAEAPSTQAPMPPGMLDFDPKTGDFLPAPDATKEQIEAAKALRDQITNGLTKVQPNNTEALESAEARAEIAANEAAEKAFKDYLEAKQDRAQFESEEAAEKARQEAFERFVKGRQSAAGAANSAKNPANAKKGKKDPKSTEPKDDDNEAKQERPWWMSSGGGPRFIMGGSGGVGYERVGGGNEASEAAAKAGAAELLKRKQMRKGAGSASRSAPPPPPSK